MRLGYVVLYVNDTEASASFWTSQMGMHLLESEHVSRFTIHRIGFPEQNVALELVPLELMKDNPDGLDLATPSLCFYVENLEYEHHRLTKNMVSVSEIMHHGDERTFGFCDNEGRWFAVMQDE